MRAIPDPAVAAVEVAAHARAQRLRLPDVEDVAGLVAKEVDARVAGKRGELLADGIGHTASVSDPMFRALCALILVLSSPRRRARAQAGGPDMSLGAAEDVVRAPDMPTAKAKMTLSPPRRIHVAPGHVAVAGSRDGPDDDGADEPQERRRRGPAFGRPGLSLRLSDGLARHAAHARRPRGVRRLPHRPEAAAPAVKDVIVGNEPNLNRFWLPQFNADGTDAAAPAYLAVLARAYDALKARRPGRARLGRRARAARRRPAGHRARHALARRLPQGHGRRLSRERTDAPRHGRPRLPPLRRQLRPVARTPHPNSTTIGLADYDRLIRSLGLAFDGTRAGGDDAAGRLRRVRRRVAHPGGKTKAYSGAEPATTKPVDEITQGAYYQQRAAARLLPAERRRALHLPHAGRAGARELAVRASTTPTGRRSRASTPSAMRSRAPAAARSPAATGSGST